MAKKSPSNPAETSTGHLIVRAVLIAILALPFVVFPPVRARSIVLPGSQVEKFSSAQFAAKLWTEKLVPSTAAAIDAHTLYQSLDANPAEAAKKYARSVGIGGTAYYYVTGQGTITSVNEDGITVALSENAKETVVLETALIFGNAVRDGTGLLDMNTFANSEEFNAIASALNAIVEKEVLPAVKKLAAPGAKIRFAGIAELISTDSDPRPLQLVPVKVESLP